MSNDQPFGTVLSLVVGGAAGYAASRSTASGGWSHAPRLHNRPVVTVMALTAAQPPNRTKADGLTHFTSKTK